MIQPKKRHVRRPNTKLLRTEVEMMRVPKLNDVLKWRMGKKRGFSQKGGVNLVLEHDKPRLLGVASR